MGESGIVEFAIVGDYLAGCGRKRHGFWNRTVPHSAQVAPFEACLVGNCFERVARDSVARRLEIGTGV